MEREPCDSPRFGAAQEGQGRVGGEAAVPHNSPICNGVENCEMTSKKCYSLGCHGKITSVILVDTDDEEKVVFHCCKRHKGSLTRSADYSKFKWVELDKRNRK